MQLHNSFEIARDVEEVFDAFLDIERIAECLPGARLTRVIDDHSFEGEVKIKVGPLAVAYAGSAQLQDVDRQAKSLQLRAKGRERSGAGNADARVVAKLSATDGGTRVDIDTDLSIRGRVAQFGRGAISEVSGQLMQQFAANVERLLDGGQRAPAAGPSPSPETSPSPSPEKSSETSPSSTPSMQDELNALTLVLPLVRKALTAALPVVAAGVAAFIGARLGSRRRR